MKNSNIIKLQETIFKFLSEMSNYEETLNEENPQLWKSIFTALVSLSNFTAFLESAKCKAAKDDVEFFNKLLKANDMPTLSGSKLQNYINKEREVDLDFEEKASNE